MIERLAAARRASSSTAPASARTSPRRIARVSKAHGAERHLLASPVSGNGKTVKAGKLSCVVSGPADAFEVAKPYLETVAGNGVAYVGEGDLARFCKIAHNVLLGVVIQNLAEITVLAEKAGVSAPRLPSSSSTTA